MYGECNASATKPYTRRYTDFTNEDAFKNCTLAIADQSRTEDYKNYWNNVFLPNDMRAACSKKGASFDDSRNECNITITLKQYGRSASNAKGLKIADNVGCDRTYTKVERIGVGTIECGGPVWNPPICFHADQQSIDDAQGKVKMAWVSGGVGVLGGVATGLAVDLSYETYQGERTENRKGLGAGLAAGATPALAGLTTGLTMGLTATGTQVGKGADADINCSTPDGMTYGKGDMIDLRW
jgi:hypothetical protein